MWESKRLRELCKKCQVVVVSHLRESFNQNVTLSISLAFFYLVAEMKMQQGGYRLCNTVTGKSANNTKDVFTAV